MPSSRLVNSQSVGLTIPPAVLSRPIDFALFRRPARVIQDDVNEESSAGVYYPEIVRMMGNALDAAWKEFKPTPKNGDLARRVMASAIIEGIEAGKRDHDVLVRKATVTLMAAIRVDPEALRA
jgi:hypothetical protein